MAAIVAQLYNILYAVIIGAIFIIIWKFYKTVWFLVDANIKLRKVYCLPRHWLLGNTRKGQVEESKTYTDIVVKAANEGHKILCMWIGPVFPIVSVLHPETYRELIKQTREKATSSIDGYPLFQSWIGDGILFSQGKKWERNRKLLTPAFHFEILNGYIQVMNEGSDALLDKLSEDTSNGKSVDIFPYICRTTLDAMLRCSLSYEGNIQKNATAAENNYIKAVQRITEIIWQRASQPHLFLMPLFNMHPLGKEFYKLCDLVHEFTGNIIQARIKELEKTNTAEIPEGKKRRLDFLDILLTAKDSEGRGLSSKEIQDEVDTFTFEGHDTTASAISWAIYALGKYPELQKKVYEDVCEVVGDSDIVTKWERPNVSIGVQIYAIHHNEAIWPNHMVFDPERFDINHRDDTDVYGFIPFSAGSRNCIGQVFALNEIKINLVKMVKRFEISLDPTKETVLLPDIVMRAEKGLHICYKPRK